MITFFGLFVSNYYSVHGACIPWFYITMCRYRLNIFKHLTILGAVKPWQRCTLLILVLRKLFNMLNNISCVWLSILETVFSANINDNHCQTFKKDSVFSMTTVELQRFTSILSNFVLQMEALTHNFFFHFIPNESCMSVPVIIHTHFLSIEVQKHLWICVKDRAKKGERRDRW